jgi:hypothetical protein
VSDEEAGPKQDVVFVHSPLEEGEGFRVIRKREDSLELGELRSVQEGRPIHGEMVRLSPRKEHDRLFDVEVVVPKQELAAAPRSGPAQVATSAYRRNWEAIFASPDSASDEPDLPN